MKVAGLKNQEIQYRGDSFFIKKYISICFVFCAYFLVISIPNLQLHTPDVAINFIPIDTQKYVFYVVPLLFLLVASFPVSAGNYMLLGFRKDPSFTLFLSFALMTVISSASASSITPLANILFLIVLLTASTLLWHLQPYERNRVLQLITLILLAYGIAGFIIYGIPQTRWVGGIHPNVFSASMLPCAMLALIAFRKWALPLVAFCLYASFLVSSRYAMVGIVVGTAFYYLAILPTLSTKEKITLYMAGFLILGIVIGRFDLISDVLQLESATRGLSSGMTGRSGIHLQMFFSQISDHYLLGYGFRQRDSYFGAHNGYLNTLLENGIILGGICIAAILMKLANLTYSSLVNRGKRRDSLRERAGITAALLAISLATFFQPQLINFGDPMGATLILLMAYPVIWNTNRRRQS